MANDERKPQPEAADRSLRQELTRLGSTVFVNGTLEGREDVVIDGRFQGKITLPSGSLTINREAKVEAEVRVRSLTLHGELIGTVAAAERALVSETGRMTGDIQTAKISVSNGARFKGTIKIEKAG
jgi:cytoskeletal protein CcmA (bactofilin family)